MEITLDTQDIVETLVTRQAQLNLEARVKEWEGLKIPLEECKQYTKQAFINLN